MSEFAELIVENLIQIVFSLISVLITAFLVPWLKNNIIPWVKEKRLYETVIIFVEAAEKYSKTHEIDKKAYVVGLLESRGIEVTPVVDAIIEAAVIELDKEIALLKSQERDLLK